MVAGKCGHSVQSKAILFLSMQEILYTGRSWAAKDQTINSRRGFKGTIVLFHHTHFSSVLVCNTKQRKYSFIVHLSHYSYIFSFGVW